MSNELCNFIGSHLKLKLWRLKLQVPTLNCAHCSCRIWHSLRLKGGGTKRVAKLAWIMHVVVAYFWHSSRFMSDGTKTTTKLELGSSCVHYDCPRKKGQLSWIDKQMDQWPTKFLYVFFPMLCSQVLRLLKVLV